MKQQVCVIGGVTWDALFTTPEARLLTDDKTRRHFLAFPYGGKVDVGGVMYCFGGGAANVSIGLAKLGVSTALISRVGRDWRGKEVAKNLVGHKVDIKWLQQDNNEKTALAFIVTTGGARDHVAFVSRGASLYTVLPHKLPSHYKWCYVTALATADWHNGLRKLFTNLKEQGQKVFWNPGSAQLKQGKKAGSLLKYIEVLDLNKEEAEMLARDLNIKFDSVKDLLTKLHRRGPACVLITDGARGAYFYDGKKIYYHKSLKIKLVNTTGAGDSFAAGWLAGYLLHKGDIKTAMRWGMVNSSSVIMHVGAQRGLLTARALKSFNKKYAQ